MGEILLVVESRTEFSVSNYLKKKQPKLSFPLVASDWAVEVLVGKLILGSSSKIELLFWDFLSVMASDDFQLNKHT